MKEKDEKGKSYRFYAIIGILTGSLVLILIFGVPWASIYPPPPDTPTTLTTSSITITDFTSNEKLDELCHVTVYGDKGKITNNEERYDITFYETVVTTEDPADFDEDLSEYDYIIVRVSPDESATQYWTTYDYMYKNSKANRDFVLNAYHEATDVFGLPLNIADGTAWDLATDTNGTISLWYPTVTETELHRGKYFDVEDDLADLSQTVLDRLWNERYYRSMPTLFTLVDDTADHDKTGDYEFMTETFAIEFDFNATINETDGSLLQVNFTTDEHGSKCRVDHLIEIINDKVYIITTESWNTYNGNLDVYYQIFMGANITCDTVKAGRIVIPDRYFGTTYTFTSLQTLATAT